MPALSSYAQSKKIDYFLKNIPKDASILEIGCGSGWVKDHFLNHNWTEYTGMDIEPPADIVGDIQEWHKLDMKQSTYDYIVAFEVVEHVDIYPACEALLKTGGKLLVTTPSPNTDWVMKILELVKLNQKRTSPHCNLHHLENVGKLSLDSYKLVAGLSQWGIFSKSA